MSGDGLSLSVPPEFVEAVAQRVAELVAERQTTTSQDGWLRGAERIAEYIDCPVSRVHVRVSARRLPVERDGSAF